MILTGSRVAVVSRAAAALHVSLLAGRQQTLPISGPLVANDYGVERPEGSECRAMAR